MTQFFTHIPGYFFYHLILLLGFESAFAITYSQWRRGKDSGLKRLLIGSGLLVALRLIALITAWVAGFAGFFDITMPPLERMFDLLTLALIGWIFITHNLKQSSKRATFIQDTLIASFAGLLIIAFIGSYYYWSSSPAGDFNGSFIDRLWSIGKLLIAGGLSISIITAKQRHKDLSLKAGSLLLYMFVGAVDYLISPAGDISIYAQLTAVIISVLYVSIIYRYVIEKLLSWDTFIPSPPAISKKAPEIQTDLPESTPGTTLEEEPEAETIAVMAEKPEASPIQDDLEHKEPDILDAVEYIAQMFSTLDASDAVKSIPKYIALALNIDICALGIVDERAEQVAIVSCYDNIAQIYLRETLLHLNHQTTIREAVDNERQLALTKQRNDKELVDFYTRLGISHLGPAYIQPLKQKGSNLGVIITGAPYSERQFSAKERNLLTRLGPLASTLLLNVEQYEKLRDSSERSLAEESTKLVEVADELTAKESELRETRKQLDEMKSYVRDAYQRAENADQLRSENSMLLSEIEDLRSQRLSGPDPKVPGGYDSSQVFVSPAMALPSVPLYSGAEPTLPQQSSLLSAYQHRLNEIQDLRQALLQTVSPSQSPINEDFKSLQTIVGFHAEEITELRNHLTEISTGVKSEEEIQNLDELNDQLEQRENLIFELQEQLDLRSEKISDLTEAVGDLEKELKAIETSFIEKEAYLSQLESQIKESDELLGEDIQSEDRIKETEAERDVLSKELEEANQQISNLKRKLQTAQVSLEEAESQYGLDEEVEETIISLVQELRSPMFSIIGYTDVLLSEKVGLLGELQQKFLLRVKSNTERMQSLLNDLIQIATLDHGELSLSDEQVNMGYLLESLIEDFSDRFLEKKIDLYFSIDSKIPPVIADIDAVSQTITNLLSNAYLASPEEGSVRLLLEPIKDPDSKLPMQVVGVHLVVIDSGVGVAEEDYDRVFMRKYRAENPLIEGLGDTGVGLSLSKTLIEAMEGEIWIENDEDFGTAFHLILPIGAPEV